MSSNVTPVRFSYYNSAAPRDRELQIFNIWGDERIRKSIYISIPKTKVSKNAAVSPLQTEQR